MSLALTAPAAAQGSDVSLRIVTAPATHAGSGSAPPIAAWLSPSRPPDRELMERLRAEKYQIVQQNKQFKPHLLVVPVGATIDFPNLDPFFHNVFSLFNGRRFDLGLYEAGGRRSVRFDREGVSYLFCNIHPEMGAVVVALNTPWFATSTPATSTHATSTPATSAGQGRVTFHDVPPGQYTLHLWGEDIPEDALRAAERRVDISASNLSLGSITLPVTPGKHPAHKNKFGDDYPATSDSPYSTP